MRHSRGGWAAGAGILVVLIAVAIMMYLMFGKLGSGSITAGQQGPSTPANITKVNPNAPAGGAGGSGGGAGPTQSSPGAGSGTGGSYVGNVLGGRRRGQETVQHIYLSEIARLVSMYELENGKYPATMEELADFAGDEGAWMRDPWGTAYSFRVDKANKTVRILSEGPDGQPNTGDEEAFDVKLPV